MFGYRASVHRFGFVALCGAGVGLLAACGPATTPNPSVSTSAVTSIGSEPGATSGGAAPSYPDTANAYAQAAMQAWSGGDTARLGQLNDPANALFTTLSSGDYNKNFSLYQCDGAAGSTICVFYNATGDETDLRLRNDLLGSPHAVADGKFIQITFPTDLKAYGQETLDGWLKHNTAAVALLTGKSGDTAFGSVPAAARTSAWTFDHEEGAMGHLYYFWHDGDGNNIGIGFINPGFASTPANRHGLVESVRYFPHS